MTSRPRPSRREVLTDGLKLLAAGFTFTLIPDLGFATGQARSSQTIGRNFVRAYGDEWNAVNNSLVDNALEPLQNPYAIGGQLSFVPSLGRELSTPLPPSKETIRATARIYALEDGRRVGYLRIPSYRHEVQAARDVARVIARLDDETDCLVLDQLNNPGGSIFEMYQVLSHLATSPLVPPEHLFNFDQEDEETAKRIIFRANIGQDVVVELLVYSRFVLEEIAAGRQKLSNPGYPGGISVIEPAEATYTKPICVLIHEMTFSAAEFLAATLQDHGRATLFGARTPGAGGLVRWHAAPHNGLGLLGYTMTWTVARRVGGEVIQNVGVEPDFHYEPTFEDVTGGYSGYREAVLAAIP